MTRPQAPRPDESSHASRTALVRLYRLLLQLLPREVRDASGDEMEGVLLDLYEARRARRGRLSAWALATRACLELLPLAVTTRGEAKRTALPPRRVMMKRVIFGSIWLDLKLSLRALRRAPGYSVAVMITLCLGIGVNTAIFSVVNGVLLRPLPYPDSDRLVYLSQPAMRLDRDNILFSLQEVADLRATSETLEEIVEFGDIGFVVQADDGAHRATGGLVTPNFFTVLGMRPLLGRTLRAEDFAEGAAPVAVLTHEYWERAFGGDPGILGRMLDVTDARAEIVGVLAPGAHYAASAGSQDFYVNYAADEHYRSAAMQNDRSHRMTTVFAKLAQGVGVDEAGAELEQIARAFGDAYPEDYPAEWGMSLRATPWKNQITARARPTLLILLVTAGFVLVAACANVANLTLMRLGSREQELSARVALGASEAQLRRLLLGETLTLTLAGASSGLLVAGAIVDSLVPYVSRFTTRTGEIGIDIRVLGFSFFVAFATALLLALAPRLERVLRNQATAGRTTSVAVHGRRTQRALVVSQFAVSLVVLVGAGLMARTLVNLYGVDPGFDLENVLRVDAPKFVWRTNRSDGAAERREFSDALVAELSAHPMIHSVAIAAAPPLQGGGARPMSFVVEDDGGGPRNPVATAMPMVSADYFATVGVALLRGRGFDPLIDVADSEPAAIIDETMANHYFGDSDPIGRRLGLPGSAEPTWFRVVGVVADSKVATLEDDGVHTFYRAESQNRSPFTILVRTRGAPSTVIPDVLETIHRLDPERPIENVQTLATLYSDYVAPQRLNATLFAMLAGLALAIAAVGIGGTLSFSVSQRRREIGIRVALGADPLTVVRLVLHEGGWLAALGLIIGLGGALLLSGFLSSMLFGVQALDPLTFAAATTFLLLVAVAASLLPARRAATVDPVEALRSV